MIEHTIQSHATLIDDDWAAFLAQHDFLVGVSLDGPAELHDVYRRDRGGKPQGATRRRGQPWRARMDARASTAH